MGGTMVRVDAPLEVVPIFARGGSVIPEGQEMNYVGEKPLDPLTFYIHPDAEGRAAGTLYEDDGTSPAYKGGAYRRTTVSVAPSGKGFQITLGAPEGSYRTGPRNLLFVAPFAGTVAEVTLDGKRLAPSAAADGKSVGYHSGKGSVGVAIEDDGQTHQIIIK
jgi:alpha-glucosidase